MANVTKIVRNHALQRRGGFLRKKKRRKQAAFFDTVAPSDATAKLVPLRAVAQRRSGAAAPSGAAEPSGAAAPSGPPSFQHEGVHVHSKR